MAGKNNSSHWTCLLEIRVGERPPKNLSHPVNWIRLQRIGWGEMTFRLCKDHIIPTHPLHLFLVIWRFQSSIWERLVLMDFYFCCFLKAILYFDYNETHSVQCTMQCNCIRALKRTLKSIRYNKCLQIFRSMKIVPLVTKSKVRGMEGKNRNWSDVDEWPSVEIVLSL